MSKKIYLPTEEDLYEIEKITERFNKENSNIYDANGYTYLIIKAIEKILVDYQNGISLESIDDYILSIPGIIHGLVWIYPHLIPNIKGASQNEDLYLDLLSKEKDDSIYVVDNLSMFDEDIDYDHYVIKNTINTLNNKIDKSPEYRFNYKESKLLDSIFSVEYQKFGYLPSDSIKKLIKLCPEYVLKYDCQSLFTDYSFIENDDDLITLRKGSLIHYGIRKVLERYGLDEFIGYDYRNIDITKNDNERIKKLKKYLND